MEAEKKATLLAAMAQHVLEHGLNSASLRPLAKAAGTSDRMLLYHFKTKDALIGELLVHLAQSLSASLSQALPDQRADTRAACVTEIVSLMRSPQLAGFMQVWFDIISSAARGQPLHHETGKQIIDGFLVWLADRLPENEPRPEKTAKAILTLIEGILVMDAFGHRDISDLAIETLLSD
jgi:AcrR family transcriptional regulator